MREAPKLVPVLFSPYIAALGVADEMVIFHELTSILVQDVSEDFLWVLTAREGTGVGCVSDNI